MKRAQARAALEDGLARLAARELAEARTALELARAGLEEDKDQARLAKLYPALAEVCDGLGDQDAVVELVGASLAAKLDGTWRRVLELRETTVGVDTAALTPTLDALASKLEAAKQHADAEPLRRRWLAIALRVGGPRDPNTGSGMALLALNLKAQGSLDEASRLLEQSIEIRRATTLPGDPFLPTRLFHLADIRFQQQRWPECLTILRDTLELEKALGSPDAPGLKRTIADTARVLRVMGREDEALELEARFAPDGEDDWLRLRELGKHLAAGGNHEGAVEMLASALALADHAGAGEALLITMLGPCANSLMVLEQWDDAEQLLQAALAIEEKRIVPGLDGQPVLAIMSKLIKCLRALGRFDGVEALSARYLAVTRKVMPAADASDEVLEQAVAEKEARLGPQHPETVKAMVALMTRYFSTERQGEAKPVVQKLIALLEQEPTGARQLLEMTYCLGKSCVALAEPEEAEQAWLRVLSWCDTTPESGTMRSRVLHDLEDLCVESGRIDDADRYGAQLDAELVARLGDTHPDVRWQRKMAGVMRANRGFHAQAIPLFERAIDSETRAGGDGDTLDKLWSFLAMARHNLGDHAGVADAYRRLAELRAALTPGDATVADAWYHAGVASSAAQAWELAEAALRRSYDLRQQLADSPEAMAKTAAALAAALRALGREEEAASLV